MAVRIAPELSPPATVIEVTPAEGGKTYDVEQVTFEGVPIIGTFEVVPEALREARIDIAPDDLSAFTLWAAGVEKENIAAIIGHHQTNSNVQIIRACRALGATGSHDFAMAHAA